MEVPKEIWDLLHQNVSSLCENPAANREQSSSSQTSESQSFQANIASRPITLPKVAVP